MANLSDMVARISNEIRRPGLATQIRNAITDAIVIYQKQRFRFSDAGPNGLTFNTVPGQSVYGATSNPKIATALHIDALNISIGSTTEWLERYQPEEIYLIQENGTQSGQPTAWAYDGNSIIVYPTPSVVYQMSIVGHVLVPAPASDTEANNPWMNEAEQLIRCRAKYEIATHITRNNEMMAAMSPDQPGATWRALRMLKGEGNKITGTGVIRSMRF